MPPIVANPITTILVASPLIATLLPKLERAVTVLPWISVPVEAVSLGCVSFSDVHPPAGLLNMYTAPGPRTLLIRGFAVAPTTTVLPSPEMDVELPNSSPLLASDAVNLASSCLGLSASLQPPAVDGLKK